MDNENKVLRLLEENGGYLTTKNAREKDVLNIVLYRMVEQGKIESAGCHNAKLLACAQVFKVDKEVRNYMDMLL